LSFAVYIPARFAARRLPGKALLDLGGRPLIAHVIARAQASGADEVVVATDDWRIAEIARACGSEVSLTAPELASGTDRIAAAARLRGVAGARVIVNLQGDEPMMPAAVIQQVAERAANRACDIATVCEALDAAQIFDPNVVKVVRDCDQRALYFSRAAIPWDREHFPHDRVSSALGHYRRHVGIYGYRADFLARFVQLPPAPLETLEQLEQLRALSHGARIDVLDAVAPCGVGIDTPDDLAHARAAYAVRAGA
jgi:3-deoxy-manno-octulosonate cytidylyltransferase (CMP-KDO synthetase)